MLSRFALLAFLLVAPSCSSSGGGSSSPGAAPPGYTLTGSWSGTWASGVHSDSGSITLSLNQVAGQVSGSAVFTGSACFGGGTVTGTISSNSFVGRIEAPGIRVNFNVSIVDLGGVLTANGSYNVVNGGVCTGDNGTLTATLNMPLVADESAEPATVHLRARGALFQVDECGEVIPLRIVYTRTHR